MFTVHSTEMRKYPYLRNIRSMQLWKKICVTTLAALICLWFSGERLPHTQGKTYTALRMNTNAEPLLGATVEDRLSAIENELSTLQRRFWLEELDPVFNYRRKFWLGKTNDVEDKDQVIPYFLANYVETSSYPRRIYIDLGIQDFESSLCWMMQHYPVKFDHIYGFECARDFSDVNNLAPNVERCINGTSAESTGYLDVPKTVGSMSLYYNYVGLDDDPATSPPTVGLSGFLRDMGLAEEDFVVMKMDVEGLEYDLIERMLDDGTYTLIDELFVEIHYSHPDMSPWPLWKKFTHSRSEAQALFTKARDKGMFIHPWP